jgi:formylglycine-generating enzyme required for sulfatase activity
MEVSPADCTIFGVVESKRKDRYITILFDFDAGKKIEEVKIKPDREILILIPEIDKKMQIKGYENKEEEKSQWSVYNIFYKKKNIGSLNSRSVMINSDGRQKLRMIAYYVLSGNEYEKLMHVGMEVSCNFTYESEFEKETEFFFNEVESLKKKIISQSDGRDMTLVPEGSFLFGSNVGDRDEYPEQEVYLGPYYIDTYEVSNNDYQKYIKETHADKPITWLDSDYYMNNGDSPVMVTYSEALAYTHWARKRLPTEQEWEKAARGGYDTNGGKIVRGIVYPWLGKFDPGRVNSMEFWSTARVGAAAKAKFTMGLLPVMMFEKEGASPYGIVNMAGNAIEWTSSWYLPYKGSKRRNLHYGTQYKVIRGGAWYNNYQKVRATNREIGGAPNLYRDSFAGFRCAKDVTVLDNESKTE